MVRTFEKKKTTSNYFSGFQKISVLIADGAWEHSDKMRTYKCAVDVQEIMD